MSAHRARDEKPGRSPTAPTIRFAESERGSSDASSVLGLQRTVGNQAVSRGLEHPSSPRFPPALIVQRDDRTPKQRLQAALDDGKPGAISDLDDDSLRAASSDERLRMIDILNDQGSTFQRIRLPRIWDAFGGELKTTADANEARWKKSFTVAASVMRGSYNVMGQRKIFYFDVQHVAGEYLDTNDRFVSSEFDRLGLTDTGDVKIGPPTADQSAALQSTRDDATKLAADQEAMTALRKIIVGYTHIESPPGGTGPPVAVGAHAPFDPDRAPGHGPLDSDQGKMKTWDEVKKEYDRLDMLVRARLMCNPTLFPLARDAHEDTSKTKAVSAGSDSDALKTIGDGLKGVRENIGKTRPLLSVLAPDLEPIHGQLLAGTRQGAPERNWKTSPFYAGIAADMVEERKPGPWWQTIGLAAAEMGVYVVAGLATGGTALAIGLAAKGAMNTALAVGKAQAMESAYGATSTEEMSLITQGQVNAAQAEVIETAAFALLDTVFAAGAVRSALRQIMQFEKVAAESAARAAVQADKWMVKEMTKDAAKQAIAEAKTALPAVTAEATSAEKALADAKAAAATAPPEESARAAASVKRAQDAATKARTAADETAAAAAGKRVPRAAAVTESGGLGSKASYEATVRAAKKEIGDAWKTMSAAERETKSIKVVTDRMAAQDIPAFAGVDKINTGGAVANWQTWRLGVDPSLFTGAHSLEDIVGLIYHEAAHFEDFVRVARMKLGEGMMPSAIQAQTGIHGRGIQGALLQGEMTAAAPEYARTKAIFESVWGTGASARNAIYRNMNASKIDLATADANYWSIVDRSTNKLVPGKTMADAQAALADYQLKATQHGLNVNLYENLPEEVRAYGVQEAVAQSFERTELRRMVLLVAAAAAALGLTGAGVLKATADK